MKKKIFALLLAAVLVITGTVVVLAVGNRSHVHTWAETGTIIGSGNYHSFTYLVSSYCCYEDISVELECTGYLNGPSYPCNETKWESAMRKVNHSWDTSTWICQICGKKHLGNAKKIECNVD